MSNTDTKDELYASFIISLVFRGYQGLPTIFGKDFGGQGIGSERLSFLINPFFDWFLRGLYLALTGLIASFFRPGRSREPKTTYCKN
jgi:hypothetical protein